MYILIFISLNYGAEVNFQEFTTKENCETALTAIHSIYNGKVAPYRQSYGDSYLGGKCVLK